MDENILQNIETHYESLGRTRIEVPEWGTEEEPLVIYSSPVTLEDRNQLKPHVNSTEFQARLIVMKAETEDGKPLFSDKIKARRAMMKKADFNVVDRIASKILRLLPDDELGNS